MAVLMEMWWYGERNEDGWYRIRMKSWRDSFSVNDSMTYSWRSEMVSIDFPKREWIRIRFIAFIMGWEYTSITFRSFTASVVCEENEWVEPFKSDSKPWMSDNEIVNDDWVRDMGNGRLKKGLISANTNS